MESLHKSLLGSLATKGVKTQLERIK